MTEASEGIVPPEIKTAKKTHSRWVDTAKAAFWGGIGTAQAGVGSVALLLAERTSNTVPATIAKVSEVAQQLGYNLSLESVQSLSDTLSNTVSPQVQMHEATAVVAFTAAALSYGVATTTMYSVARRS